MTRRVIFLALMLASGSLAVSAGATHAAECPATGPIMQSCELTRTRYSPIVIGANDVMLDCHLRTIKKTGTQREMGSYGITVTGKNNITIQNCVVWGWEVGIRVEKNPADNDKRSTNITLRNNKAYYNDDGFDINDSDGILIQGGGAFHNTGDGIDLDRVSMVMINGVHIDHNTDKGIALKDGPNSDVHIVQNNIERNGVGIRFQRTNDAYFDANCFSANNTTTKMESDDKVLWSPDILYKERPGYPSVTAFMPNTINNHAEPWNPTLRYGCLWLD